MNKITDTFYKGNSKRFGLGAWNSVKDDFYEISKSQNIKMPTPNNLDNNLNNPSSIYNPSNQQNMRYNHFSPNLIRMQYFDDQIKEIQHRRNVFLQDYIKNAEYNVYYNQYNPLLDRRKNVQIRLQQIKNKLLNDEQEDLMREKQKIEEENRIIDNLIMENERKDNHKIFEILEKNDRENYEKDFLNDHEEKVKPHLSNKYSKENSVLILSRSSSKKSVDDDIDFDLLEAEENNDDDDIFSSNTSLAEVKKNKSKRKSLARKSISQKKNHHTNILKVLMNIERQAKPIDNVNDELIEQSKQVGINFNQLYHNIKDLKYDLIKRMSNLNNKYEETFGIFQNILMMSENANMKRALENALNRIGEKKLPIEKEYLDPDLVFKNQMERAIDLKIVKYDRMKKKKNYYKKLKNEPKLMEKDFDYRIKNNERSKFGKINVVNLYNKMEKLEDVQISPNNNLDNQNKIDEVKDVINISGTKNKSYLTIYKNDKSEKSEKIDKGDKGIGLPPQQDLNKIMNDNQNIMNIENQNKKKKKKKHKRVIITDLGRVRYDYLRHKDLKHGRKETIIELGEDLNDNKKKDSKGDNKDNDNEKKESKESKEEEKKSNKDENEDKSKDEEKEDKSSEKSKNNSSDES